MFQVQTSNGNYAVKRLNSEIMKRDTVWFHYELSERFTRFAVDHSIAGLPAIVVNDEYIFSINEDHYMIFPWVKGICGADKKINKIMCYKVGSVLSKIHLLDFPCEDKIISGSHIEWVNYLDLAKIKSNEIYELLEKHINELKNIENCINESSPKYPTNTISHRDLDPKNIIWQGDIPIVIDWEASGSVNATVELMEVCLSWSNGGKDESLFAGVLKAYNELISTDKDDFSGAVLCTLTGKFGWLDYNLRRGLGLETRDEKDQILGIKQVKHTISDILCSYESSSDIINMIKRM